MSEPENFLERWSRRKRAADENAQGDKPAANEETVANASADTAAPDAVGSIQDAVSPVFDLESLPPIESIEAATDIRAFLAPGVPAELTRAALRRAWQTDPNIRDFIGIAENQWDFTKPDGVPGFGTLPFGPQVREMVANLLEAIPHKPPSQDAAEVAQAPEMSGELPPASAGPVSSTAGTVTPLAAPETGEDPPTAEAEPDRVVAQDGETSAAVQNDDESGAQGSQIAHRRHGSAVPR